MGLVIGIVIAAMAGPALGQDLVFQNATVIDGAGSPPREGVTVVVRGGRIASLGASGAPSPGTRTIDLIIVDRNPLEDLRALFEPLLVVTDGKVVLDRLYPNPYSGR